MSDSRTTLICPHCRKPVIIVEEKDLVDEDGDAGTVDGKIVEQTKEDDSDDFRDPAVANIGFRK